MKIFQLKKLQGPAQGRYKEITHKFTGKNIKNLQGQKHSQNSKKTFNFSKNSFFKDLQRFTSILQGNYTQNYKDFTRNLQGIYKEFSKNFQGVYNGATQKLQPNPNQTTASTPIEHFTRNFTRFARNFKHCLT